MNWLYTDVQPDKILISASHLLRLKLGVTAIIVPKVTRDLPFSPVSLKAEWKHLLDLDLADPDLGHPCSTPVAFETLFGWVLAGFNQSLSPDVEVATCHVSCATGDEDGSLCESSLSPEE